MKITKLVAALNDVLEKHGDCEVRTLDSTEGAYFTVDEVQLVEDGKFVDGFNGGSVQNFLFVELR